VDVYWYPVGSATVRQQSPAVSEHDWFVLRVHRCLAICSAAVLMAGCSSQPNLDSYVVGPHGHQMRIAAAAGQHRDPVVAGGTSAGTSVLPGAINYATTLALPDKGSVRIAISVPTRTVALAHAHWIINDYFNNDPERLTTWHGTPADLGVRPCNTPAGSCPGYLGGFQVFRSGTLYNVTIDSDNSSIAWAVIHSVRVSADG
jgi:hypothetical protein